MADACNHDQEHHRLDYVIWMSSPVGSTPCRMAVLRLCAALLTSVTWLPLAQPAFAQADIPPLTGRVMDPADILSVTTERTLTELLELHEDSTGNQIVVATVPSLDGEAIEEYALRAGRTWQIGTAEYDNGILLIVAPVERKVRIEVGYGLEGAVPDAVAARIIRNEIIPKFRDGDFDGGVAAGTMALLEAVDGEYEVESSGSGEEPPLAVRIVFGLAFGVMVILSGFGALMARSKTGRWIAFTFLLPFAFLAGGFAAMSFPAGLITASIFAGVFLFLTRRPSVQSLRERIVEASKKDKPSPVAVGPFTFHVGGSSGGGSGSSGRSSFGGGGFSGGGFSGGGGSFGGGGASGGW